MVVAQQVEHTVDQQAQQLVVERAAPSARLTRSGVDRDHHVAEHGPAALDVWTLEQRVGEDVGGTAPAAVALVQLGDRRIVHQCQRELRVRAADLAQEATRAAREQSAVDGRAFRGAAQADRHAPFVTFS